MPKLPISRTVTPDDFNRIRHAFELAAGRPPDERRALLEQLCGGDTLMIAEVERLLADEREHSRLPGTRETSPSAGVRPAREMVSVGSFTPGAILGNRYRIIAQLGRGAMGEVYRADDLKLGQPVALKFLPPRLATDPVMRERFFAEVRITRQLAHPNICRVYDIEEVAGLHFLSMEYIDGENLASLLKRIGHLSNEKALDIARQLVAGLAAAHERSVLHRDLKPSNIMIDGHGRARITDFGLAIAMTDHGSARDGAGTPAYMAPEQLAGEAASVRSDIYSLGLVLYEIHTGKRAYAATTPFELREQKLERSPQALGEIRVGMDPRVERLIMQCLEYEPRLRPTSVAQLAALLPGGDPLAAALAAGETPSPDMVAAAGPAEGLGRAAASTLFAIVIVSAFAAVALNEQSMLLQRAGPGRPPEVLIDRARELIRTAGYVDEPADTTFGFTYDREAIRYFQDMGGGDRWSKAETSLAVLFMYRQSPRPLARSNVLHLVSSEIAHPPLELSGDIRVYLDIDGRLRKLEAIPPQVKSAGDERIDVQWSQLFAAAGLDASAWSPVEPRWNPPTFADSVTAWEGSLPEKPEMRLRIEGAAYRGQPVAFELIGPWTHPARSTTRMPSGSERVSTATWLLLQTALIVTAGLFARRNLRLGRGDRRGATRLALFVAAVLVVRWIVVEHHVPTAWEMALFDMFVGTTLYAAALVWIFYIAIEPSVRRRWPHTLVSWTRIVAGRWRDPLVGRELLLGCATGCIIASLYLLAIMAPSWVGYPRAMLTDMPDVFLPGQSFVAGVLFSLFEAIFSSLAFFCLAFFLHLLLRNAQLTMIVWTLIVGSVQSLSTMSQSWWISAPLIIVALLCMYLVMIRAGWVPLFVGRFVGNLLILCPLTFDSSVWHAEVGYAALSVIGAIGFYGCWTSLGGRPILSASVNSP